MKRQVLVVGSLALTSLLIALVACGTRNNRPASGNNPSGLVKPKGSFEGKPETNLEAACTPNKEHGIIDKDLKAGDQFAADMTIISPAGKTMKGTTQVEVIEVSNSLMRSNMVIAMDGMPEMKSEKKCEVVNEKEIKCETVGAENKKKPVEGCKIKPIGEAKVELSKGTYKMVNGQTVNAVHRVSTKTGEISCMVDGAEVTMGKGTSIEDEYLSAEIIKLPSEKLENCIEEQVFLAHRMTTDGGKQVLNITVETTKAPVRKK